MKNQLESYRSYLFTVAYNIIGEIFEAEDLVQEAFVYFLTLDESHVQNPKSYLTRIVANKAIDRLKVLKKQRENYPGTWLPEPLVFDQLHKEKEENDILSYEVLSKLQSLNPVERAIFVLREAFEIPYQEIASICNITETNCRKILSRVKEKIPKSEFSSSKKNDHIIPLIEAFIYAIIKEDTSTLKNLLKEEIALFSDGGGKAAAALNPLYGNEIVSKFLIGIGRKNKELDLKLSFVNINHQPGILLYSENGPESLVSFSEEAGVFSSIYIVRNPDKLLSLKSVTK